MSKLALIVVLCLCAETEVKVGYSDRAKAFAKRAVNRVRSSTKRERVGTVFGLTAVAVGVVMLRKMSRGGGAPVAPVHNGVVPGDALHGAPGAPVHNVGAPVARVVGANAYPNSYWTYASDHCWLKEVTNAHGTKDYNLYFLQPGDDYTKYIPGVILITNNSGMLNFSRCISCAGSTYVYDIFGVDKSSGAFCDVFLKSVQSYGNCFGAAEYYCLCSITHACRRQSVMNNKSQLDCFYDIIGLFTSFTGDIKNDGGSVLMDSRLITDAEMQQVKSMYTSVAQVMVSRSGSGVPVDLAAYYPDSYWPDAHDHFYFEWQDNNNNGHKVVPVTLTTGDDIKRSFPGFLCFSMSNNRIILKRRGYGDRSQSELSEQLIKAEQNTFNSGLSVDVQADKYSAAERALIKLMLYISNEKHESIFDVFSRHFGGSSFKLSDYKYNIDTRLVTRSQMLGMNRELSELKANNPTS